MAAAAPIGLALSAASPAVGAYGAYAGSKYEQARAKIAAEEAKVAADQTVTTMTEELNSTISGIRAVRAAVGLSSETPTARAIIAGETKTSERQTRIQRGNLQRQASQLEADAKYMGKAARWGLIGGAMKTAVPIMQGWKNA